jgi:hypothetical protein
MKNVKEIISSLREEVNKYREVRGKLYILDDVLAVEIAINLTEFCLKKNRPIELNEEIWFEASYALAQSLDGTEWESIYSFYKELVDYVKNNSYFRKDIPKIDW